METNKNKLLETLSYKDFEALVLETGVFADEIISDYVLDMQEGVLNGMVTGSIIVPTVKTILEENGQMHFEMLQMYYND